MAPATSATEWNGREAQACTATAPARAPATATAKAKATALLLQGNKKLDAGVYLEALQLFKKAYRIYPSPLLHFNIAQTYNELGKFLDALTHYELFVKKVKEDPARKKLFGLFFRYPKSRIISINNMQPMMRKYRIDAS